MEDEEELRRMRLLWRSMGGGDLGAADGGEERAESCVSGVDRRGMEEISDFFRRDSRRYDGGFALL